MIERLCNAAAGGVSPPALLRLLDRFERTDPSSLVETQLHQARRVAVHAHRTVPAYAEPLAEVAHLPPERLDLDAWRRIPTISRARAQAAGDAMLSAEPPPGHAAVGRSSTSGSTGRPLTIRTTAASRAVNQALALRYDAWFRRDHSAKAAFITNVLEQGSADPPHGRRAESWAPGVATGPGAVLTLSATVAEQVAWLKREKPKYLSTFSSNALALARRCEQTGDAIPGLELVSVSSEPATPELRAACARALGVRVSATYSANETGALGFECPDRGSFHVQSENVLLEVLDDAGAPCEPGQTGRVVVTTLHNLAMPLVRYEIGDYAEVGPPCACGRPHPVLKRIAGRARNMLTLPSGEQVWPYFRIDRLVGLKKLRQWQLVQRARDHVHVSVVADSDLSANEVAEIQSAVNEFVPEPIAVSVERVAAIARQPGGKFEEFVNLVGTAPPGAA